MIVIEAAGEKSSTAVRGLAKRDLNRFVSSVTEALGLDGEISILLTSNERLRALNLQFRAVDKPTDVLSFPALPDAEGRSTGGDLAISLDIALAQAADHGHSLQMEIKVLILHGLLHLAGFDHERDHGQMRRRETALRRKFVLPAGLVERSRLAQQPGGRS